MIIKSMSRKAPSYEQLYDYIVRDHDNDRAFNFTHNFFGQNREAILDEFMSNAQHLNHRKNGNYLYHEVISITRSKQLSEAKQKSILKHLAQVYIQSRAQDCLVFAGMHDEKNNQLHYHLIISANRVNERSRYRLSKRQFDDIKRQLELYALEHYPELEQAKLISQEKGQGKTSNKEQQLKRRTGKPSQKDIIRDKLNTVFAKAHNKSEYIRLLQEAKLSFYIRGKTLGFTDTATKRNHRLKTLGLEDEFMEMSQRIELAEKTGTKTSSKQQKQSHASNQANDSKQGNNEDVRQAEQQQTKAEAEKTTKQKPRKTKQETAVDELKRHRQARKDNDSHQKKKD